MKLKLYPKYKDSGVQWIGKIPEGWGLSRGKHQYKIFGGYAFSSEDFIDEGSILIRIGDMQEGSIDFCNCKRLPLEYAISKKEFRISSKDVLIAMTGATIGKVSQVQETREKLLLNQRVGKVKTSNCLDYIKYILNSDLIQEQIHLIAEGGAQENISSEQLESFIIPLLDNKIQKRIVSFLDKKISDINILIEKDKSLIELLKEKRVALINHAVTKGLNPKVKMKDSGIDWIGKIPEGWDIWKIEHLARLYSGGTPDRSNESYWDNGEIPWIASGEVNQIDIIQPTSLISKEGFINSSAKWIPKNSLVIALAGQGKTKGMVAYLRIKTTGNQSLGVIVPIKVNSRYLFYWLKRNYFNIRGLAGEGIRDGLSLDMIKEIRVPMPPKSEQIQIAEYLDKATSKIDKTIQKIEEKITLLEEFKKSLIYHVVTGKVDIQEAIA
ncbi:MAG: restriction endonuclease subunit S [Candidatus Omnitrophica bacterium]|nr:restriction endonuclease subunit S [Candidatus Omnitrophota bacterium]